MLTHGTGTPGNKHWKINTSFNTEIANQSEFAVPLLDFNYGVKAQTQLKFEIPYLIVKTENKNISSSIGNAVIGVKHRFVEEERHFISFSVYPQIEFSFNKGGHTEYKLLTQFKKTIHSRAPGAPSPIPRCSQCRLAPRGRHSPPGCCRGRRGT